MTRILSIVGIGVAAIVVAPVVSLGLAATSVAWPAIPILFGAGAAFSAYRGNGSSSEETKNQKP